MGQSVTAKQQELIDKAIAARHSWYGKLLLKDIDLPDIAYIANRLAFDEIDKEGLWDPDTYAVGATTDVGIEVEVDESSPGETTRGWAASFNGKHYNKYCYLTAEEATPESVAAMDSILRDMAGEVVMCLVQELPEWPK